MSLDRVVAARCVGAEALLSGVPRGAGLLVSSICFRGITDLFYAATRAGSSGADGGAIPAWRKERALCVYVPVPEENLSAFGLILPRSSYDHAHGGQPGTFITNHSA